MTTLPSSSSSSSPSRRDALAEAATDYALRQGLIGLSLRPLGAAIGTSDRMLLYHFRDKDDLVSTVLRVANDQGVAEIRSLPASASVRQAVVELWAAATTGLLERCQRLYVQAAALGLLGHEPYLTVVREANQRWIGAVADHLRRAGCAEGSAPQAAFLVVATFMGLHLDLPLNDENPAVDRAIADLADTVGAITA